MRRLGGLCVLRVLLIVWMKIVDCIVHDIARIHSLLQTTRDALHGHRTGLIRIEVALIDLNVTKQNKNGTLVFADKRAIKKLAETNTNLIWKRKSKCQRCKEHFNAN